MLRLYSIFLTLLAFLCQFPITSNSFSMKFPTICTRALSALSTSSGDLNIPLKEAETKLKQFDSEYIGRMKAAKASNVTLKELEFKRAQSLTASGIQREREDMAAAIRQTAAAASAVVLGIKAERGVKAIDVLRAWVGSLSLPRGVLRAVDENNNEVELSSWDDRPVYVKYNSTDNGDAYMKPYNGEYYGVLYQPVMHAENSAEFSQYGDFPLLIFRVSE